MPAVAALDPRRCGAGPRRARRSRRRPAHAPSLAGGAAGRCYPELSDAMRSGYVVDRPEIILAPGPTPIPPEVLLAQGSPLVYHRGPGFGRLMRETTARLRELFRTSGDVLLMTSSGTGGLESAVQNLFSPGDEVLVPDAGFFAHRLRLLAEAYGLSVNAIEYEWGQRVRAEDVAEALAR